MAGWYVKVEGTGPLGPLPTEQVSDGLTSGRLRPDVLVCRVGGDTWHPLAAFPEFGSPVGTPPPPPDSKVGVGDEDAPELAPGRELGSYKITRRIGSGGMGEVYEAVHTRLRKRVALKTLRQALARNGEARVRFLREGETASRLRHPNVVDITDVGEADGVPFLVMELLEGEALAALLRRLGTLSVMAAVDIILPVVDAVAVAHEHGIIHRDLKPDNIFLAQTHLAGIFPKVLDFGISKVLSDAQAPSLTATSSFLGTPFYMSPEQARGAKDIDGRSDQYSLGVVLYEALTGQQPHAACGDSLMQLVHAIARGEFPAPRALRPDLPPVLEGILLRAMSLSPNDRYDSMRSLGTALVPFASDRGRSIWGVAFQASPHIVAPSSDAAAASLAPVRAASNTPAAATTLERGGTAVTAETSPQPARRAGVMIAIGAVLVGVAGVLGWVLTRSNGASPEPAAATAAASARYHVAVQAEPRSASIELDGQPVGAGSFTADLPRDGARHTLTVAAPGFVPQTLVFRDEAPPSSVALVGLPNQARAADSAASAERANVAQPGKKRVAGVRVEPPAVQAEPAEPAKAGRRTDNIDPWEK
jgi:eukaryotic-like serine/threonine-protein kinase